MRRRPPRRVPAKRPTTGIRIRLRAVTPTSASDRCVKKSGREPPCPHLVSTHRRRADGWLASWSTPQESRAALVLARFLYENRRSSCGYKRAISLDPAGHSQLLRRRALRTHEVAPLERARVHLQPQSRGGRTCCDNVQRGSRSVSLSLAPSCSCPRGARRARHGAHVRAEALAALTSSSRAFSAARFVGSGSESARARSSHSSTLLQLLRRRRLERPPVCPEGRSATSRCAAQPVRLQQRWGSQVSAAPTSPLSPYATTSSARPQSSCGRTRVPREIGFACAPSETGTPSDAGVTRCRPAYRKVDYLLCDPCTVTDFMRAVEARCPRGRATNVIP